MSFGLITKRTDGTLVLTPEMFTVRPVETFLVESSAYNWGEPEYTNNLRIPRSLVKAGMFATSTPVRQYVPHDPGRNFFGMAGNQLAAQAVQTPKLVCGDGYVELSVPIAGGSYTRQMYIHVFEYV